MRAWVLPWLAALGASASLAQDFPTRPIKIVSPYSAGGLGDILPRLVGKSLQEQLGQSVIVENIPGASTIMGTAAVAKAAPDGYTLLFTSATAMAVNPTSQKNLPYDPLRDFAPVSLAFNSAFYLIVHPKLGVNSLAELVALAKARPGQLTYASGGNATASHFAGELFKTRAGVDIVHVPYKGAGPGLVDVMGGHVDMTFEASGAEIARQGQLRVLAMSAAQRSPEAPDIPTMQEAGIADYEVNVWFGFAAPAGTPRPVVNLLSREIGKALAQPALREKVHGVDITPSTPEAFAARIPADIAWWRKLIAETKITFE